MDVTITRSCKLILPWYGSFFQILLFATHFLSCILCVLVRYFCFVSFVKIVYWEFLLIFCHQYMELFLCSLCIFSFPLFASCHKWIMYILNNSQLFGRISITWYTWPCVTDAIRNQHLYTQSARFFCLLSFARKIRPTSLNIDKDVTWLCAISINHTISWMTTDFEIVNALFVGGVVGVVVIVVIVCVCAPFFSQSTVCSV